MFPKLPENSPFNQKQAVTFSPFNQARRPIETNLKEGFDAANILNSEYAGTNYWKVNSIDGEDVEKMLQDYQ